MTRDDLFNTNASIVKKLAESCARYGTFFFALRNLIECKNDSIEYQTDDKNRISQRRLLFQLSLAVENEVPVDSL